MRTFEQHVRRAKAFVFDFYGTLVVDAVSVPPMWQHLNELGYRSDAALQAIFEPDAFDGCLTPSFTTQPSHNDWMLSNWRRFVELSGVPHEFVDRTLTILLNRQAEFRVKCAPGAVELLSLLRNHDLKVGLCSNWESPIEPLLGQAFLPTFDAITISAQIGARKPHRAMFEDICSKLDTDRANITFVGDNWSADIMGALREGLFPIWIRGDKPPSVLPHLVADFRTLLEFDACLREVMGAKDDARQGDRHYPDA